MIHLLMPTYLWVVQQQFIDVGAAGGNRGKIGYSSNNLYFGTSSSSGEFIFKNNVTSTDNPASSGTERFRISEWWKCYCKY